MVDDEGDPVAELAAAARAADVPGAVLGIERDGVRTVIPYGVVNRATGAPVGPDSLFHIGSISKSWTATMIMQLEQDGRLGLDQPIAELVPDLPIAAADAITVRHLLTHTSGIDGDIFTDTGPGLDCVERYVATLGSAPQVFAPGAAYSYCNTGYVLLGRIIETLDAMAWEESLHERLIAPLGLTHTTVRAEQAILHSAAVGHRGSDGAPVHTWQLAQSIAPAGLICQRMDDLLDYVTAIHLDPTPALARMQEHQHDIGFTSGGITGTGMGWRRHRFGDRELFGHDGSTVGQNAFLRIDPQARLVVALFTNAATGSTLWSSIGDRVFTRELGVGLPRLPEPVDVAVDDRHVGSYERAGVRLEVTPDDGGLAMRYAVTGASLAFAEDPVHHYRLRPVDASGDRFVARESDEEPWSAMSFGRFPDGRAYHFGGRVTPRVES